MDHLKLIKWLEIFILPLGKAFTSQMFICMICWPWKRIFIMYDYLGTNNSLATSLLNFSIICHFSLIFNFNLMSSP